MDATSKILPTGVRQPSQWCPSGYAFSVGLNHRPQCVCTVSETTAVLVSKASIPKPASTVAGLTMAYITMLTRQCLVCTTATSYMLYIHRSSPSVFGYTTLCTCMCVYTRTPPSSYGLKFANICEHLNINTWRNCYIRYRFAIDTCHFAGCCEYRYCFLNTEWKYAGFSCWNTVTVDCKLTSTVLRFYLLDCELWTVWKCSLTTFSLPCMEQVKWLFSMMMIQFDLMSITLDRLGIISNLLKSIETFKDIRIWESSRLDSVVWSQRQSINL